jgi:hypothetical protein
MNLHHEWVVLLLLVFRESLILHTPKLLEGGWLSRYIVHVFALISHPSENLLSLFFIIVNTIYSKTYPNLRACMLEELDTFGIIEEDNIHARHPRPRPTVVTAMIIFFLAMKPTPVPPQSLTICCCHHPSSVAQALPHRPALLDRPAHHCV